MKKINLAHIREHSTTGGYIDFIVFDAKSTINRNDKLLKILTNKARTSGLKVDKSALVYKKNNHTEFYGTKDLVDYLANNGLPQWTHTLDVP